MPLALTANVVTHLVNWWNKLRLHTELKQAVRSKSQLIFSCTTLTAQLFIWPVYRHSLFSQRQEVLPMFSFRLIPVTGALSLSSHKHAVFRRQVLVVLKHLIFFCLSAVLGVWYPAYPGWETQEVWSLSWGVCVCCFKPVFGHCLPVPPPAAAHRPLPLTLNLHDRTPKSNAETHYTLKPYCYLNINLCMYLDWYWMKSHNSLLVHQTSVAIFKYAGMSVMYPTYSSLVLTSP